jgi:SAM-dependent methyltransferase
LGYQCSAYDDLQDDWHLLPGNREKILYFAKECGIDFKLAANGPMPFEKNWFDMIILNSVLEHLHDSPRDLLNDLIEFIKPGGLLYITVPNAVNIRKRIDVMLGYTNLPRYDIYYWYNKPIEESAIGIVSDDLDIINPAPEGGAGVGDILRITYRA